MHTRTNTVTMEFRKMLFLLPSSVRGNEANLPSPTTRFGHLQYVKQMMVPYPGLPGYDSFVPNHCHPQYMYMAKYRNTVGSKGL